MAWRKKNIDTIEDGSWSSWRTWTRTRYSHIVKPELPFYDPAPVGAKWTSNDVIKAGEALENINTSYLSDSAKQTYNTLNGSIADSHDYAMEVNVYEHN